MVDADLHTHTSFSDGTCGAEELVLAAIKKGLKIIGITDHGHTPFDESYCMKKEDFDRYVEELRALKKKFEGSIEVRVGLEEDLFSEISASSLDFVIGSVHYLKIGDKFVEVDGSPEILLAAAKEYFGGDALCLAERYFEEVGTLAEKKECGIVGHFDLIAKFNEKIALFDENDPRYVSAWKAAAARLIEAGKTFEINTGAMHRGYRSVPYPAKKIFDHLKKSGARFVFGSDSHSSRTLGYAFDEIAKEYGV